MVAAEDVGQDRRSIGCNAGVAPGVGTLKDGFVMAVAEGTNDVGQASA